MDTRLDYLYFIVKGAKKIHLGYNLSIRDKKQLPFIEKRDVRVIKS
jgi:hypothetical protein